MSYQTTEINLGDGVDDDDVSVTDLDDLNSAYILKNNLLSNFNFASMKWHKVKYYVIAAIAVSVLILLMSSPSSSSSSSMAPFSTDDAVKSKDICEANDYFKRVLKEEYTATFQIIKDAQDAQRFEASGVVYDASRDVFWVVFDSLHALGKITSDIMRSSENLLVHPVNANNVNSDYFNGKDSDFEGITLDETTDTLYILTESVLFKDNMNKVVYHPVIRQAKYDERSTYTVTSLCAVDFEAPSDNKGMFLVRKPCPNPFSNVADGNMFLLRANYVTYAIHSAFFVHIQVLKG